MVAQRAPYAVHLTGDVERKLSDLGAEVRQNLLRVAVHAAETLAVNPREEGSVGTLTWDGRVAVYEVQPHLHRLLVTGIANAPPQP